MFVSDIKLGKSIVVDGAAMTLESIDPSRTGCIVNWNNRRIHLRSGNAAMLVDEGKRIKFAMVRDAPHDFDEVRLGVEAPQSVKIWKPRPEDM